MKYLHARHSRTTRADVDYFKHCFYYYTAISGVLFFHTLEAVLQRPWHTKKHEKRDTSSKKMYQSQSIILSL